MSTRERVTRGFTWLLSGRVANALVGLASAAVLARVLTPSDFGVAAGILLVLSFTNAVFDGAFGFNLIRKKILREEDIRTTLTAAMLLGALGMALLVLAATFSSWISTFPQLTLILLATSISIPLKSLYSVASALLQRDSRFKELASTSLAAQFIGYVVLGIPLALHGAGIWALVTAIIMSGACEALLTAFAAKISMKPAWHKQALRDIAASSAYTVTNLLGWLAYAIPSVFVARTLGATELGFFSRGWKLLDLVVSTVAIPMERTLVTAFAARRDSQIHMTSALINTLHAVVPFYTVLSVICVLQAPAIIAVTLGSQWSETVIISQLFFAAMLPRCAYKVSENFSIAAGRSGSAVARQAFLVALMAVGAWAGASHGAQGIAAAIGLCITLFYVVSLRSAIKLSNVDGIQVLAIHGRAALLAMLVALPNGLILLSEPALPGALVHGIAAAASILSAVALGIIWPNFWFGKDNGIRFKEAAVKLLEKFRTHQ